MAALDMNKLHSHLDSYINILLGKYPNLEVTNTYKNGMFKTKTKSVTSLTVVYYLLKILVPNKLSRVLWPLYDNKMEAEFRRIALELLADIFKGSSRVHTINMSVLITTHNVKFVHILVNLCTEILRRDLVGQGNEALISRMNQLEGQCMGGRKTGEEEGVRVLAEEVERVATFRLAEQLKTAACCVKEAKLQASDLSSNIKQTENSIIKLNSKGKEFLKSNNLNENLMDEESKLQDFHRQVAARSSHLNQLISQTALLLSNVTICNQTADTPLLHLNAREGEPVDLAAVVKQARQFRDSNPMVRMFGTADSQEPACITLVKQFTSLVSSTDNAITKDIEEYASTLTMKQAAYNDITQQLKEAINWCPAIPEPNLVICNTEWLNNWDACIKGEQPSSCEPSTEPPPNETFVKFTNSVRRFLDSCHAEENQKEQEKKNKIRPKTNLMDMLFSDNNQENTLSPPSRAGTVQNNVTQQQNGDCQQNTVMSPTTSSGCSPIACSSRLMSSLASTPVKKYDNSSPTSTTTPTPLKKHHDNSLLHQLLYNKMAAADQPQSPPITGGSPMAGISPNMSFELNGKLPANLSQTTVGTESLSSNSFLERSVLSPQRRISNVFDALLNESSSSPCSLQSPLVPSIPSPLMSCVSPSLQSPLVPNSPSPLVLSTFQSPPVRPTPTQSKLVDGSNRKEPPTECQLQTPNHNDSVRQKPRKSILELAERFRRLKMQADK